MRAVGETPKCAKHAERPSSATARITMDSNCNKSAEVNGGTPFAEARGSAADVELTETEYPACPNCQERKVVCACLRNTCFQCGKPVGNITFTVCDECWDKPPNAEVSEGGTRDSRIETAAQSRPSLH